METMKSIFVKPTPREQMRAQQREFRTIQRDLDRDRLQLQRQGKQIELEIKKAAKQGNMTQAKTLAKQLLRVRKQQDKNMQVGSSISAVSHRTTAMHSNLALGNAVKGATKAMTASNKQLNLQKLQNTMMEFERQSTQLDMSEEMMNDTIDGVMDDEDDEAEGEDIMNQVFDEIGIELNGKLASAPRSTLPERHVQEAEEDAADVELRRRLEALKSLRDVCNLDIVLTSLFVMGLRLTTLWSSPNNEHKSRPCWPTRKHVYSVATEPERQEQGFHDGKVNTPFFENTPLLLWGELEPTQNEPIAGSTAHLMVVVDVFLAVSGTTEAQDPPFELKISPSPRENANVLPSPMWRMTKLQRKFALRI
ncbi:Snf7-domain-containing protein, partial [Jimgerdemannia flammicorona]